MSSFDDLLDAVMTLFYCIISWDWTVFALARLKPQDFFFLFFAAVCNELHVIEVHRCEDPRVRIGHIPRPGLCCTQYKATSTGCSRLPKQIDIVSQDVIS